MFYNLPGANVSYTTPNEE